MSNIVTSKFVLLLYFISLTTKNFEKLKAIHQTFASNMSQIFRQISGKKCSIIFKKKKPKKIILLYPIKLFRANSHRSPKACSRTWNLKEDWQEIRICLFSYFLKIFLYYTAIKMKFACAEVTWVRIQQWILQRFAIPDCIPVLCRTCPAIAFTTFMVFQEEVMYCVLLREESPPDSPSNFWTTAAGR